MENRRAGRDLKELLVQAFSFQSKTLNDLAQALPKLCLVWTASYIWSLACFIIGASCALVRRVNDIHEAMTSDSQSSAL